MKFLIVPTIIVAILLGVAIFVSPTAPAAKGPRNDVMVLWDKDGKAYTATPYRWDHIYELSRVSGADK